jgi:hypothetical protein
MTMRRLTLGIAGTLLASALAGCGEPAPQDEAVPVQRSNSEQFNAAKGQLERGIKSDTYTKKPEELEAADAKPADAKAAPAKPADAKTPDAKPAPPAGAPKAAEPKATPPPAAAAKTPEKQP